jgi:hypothetical protein
MSILLSGHSHREFCIQMLRRVPWLSHEDDQVPDPADISYSEHDKKVLLFQLQSYFGEITQILTLNWQKPAAIFGL